MTAVAWDSGEEVSLQTMGAGNLLADHLIRATLMDGARLSLTLPGLLAALSEDGVLTLPALRPHQRHPWHAFTVQVAALALGPSRDGRADWPGDEQAWARALRALIPGHPADDSWSLIVDDPSRPAFMQPPAPEGTLRGYKGVATTPDATDVLITAKNHDLKREMMARAAPDDWVFALVSLQTQEGFLGAGSYGVSRMNGGYGNRPGMGLAPEGGPGARWRRDVGRLRSALWQHRRASRPEWDGYDAEAGLGLVWLRPWDGAEQLVRNDLHPLYVEVCRRLRLTRGADGSVLARRTTTRAARVKPSDGGATGDPWTPVALDDGKALSVGRTGFDHRRLSELLFGDTWRLPLLAEVGPGESGPFTLVCQALARGQGKTEGYHERLVPLPARILPRLFGDDRPCLGELAKQRIELVGKCAAALAFAGRVLVQAGPEKVATDAARNAFVAALAPCLAARADATFFDDLWAEIEGEAAAAAVRHGWMVGLKEQALALLLEAGQALPLAASRRPRALIKAHRAFESQLCRTEPWQHLRSTDRDPVVEHAALLARAA